MTEKELKKLNRKQLLELLLIQTSRADALESELDSMRQELAKQEIIKTEAGSIAEAALKLNGVFEAAEAAAAQYLVNIKRLNKQLEYRVMENHSSQSIEAQDLSDIILDNKKQKNVVSSVDNNQSGWFNILLSGSTDNIVDDES